MKSIDERVSDFIRHYPEFSLDDLHTMLRFELNQVREDTVKAAMQAVCKWCKEGVQLTGYPQYHLHQDDSTTLCSGFVIRAEIP